MGVRLATNLGYRFYANHLSRFYNCDWIIGRAEAAPTEPMPVKLTMSGVGGSTASERNPGNLGEQASLPAKLVAVERKAGEEACSPRVRADRRSAEPLPPAVGNFQ